MPWDIRQGTSQCSGYGVFKEGTDELSGCHKTRDAAEKQLAALYASEPDAAKSVDVEFEKYRGELYAQLTEEEKAFHDALLSIAEQYGPFDLGTSSIWVGYESAEENEDAEIGVMCASCSFFNPSNNGCAILSYAVEPRGKCRLAAIPDGYVTPKTDEDEGEEMDKNYTGCGCETCKRMDVACKDCPACNMEMDKAEGVRVGQMVSWNSSGGRAEGKVKRVVRSGSYNVPDSDFTITGTEENPAVVIELYREGKPTGRMVGHRMSTLTAKKSLWSGAFNPRDGLMKRG
jgi:hypothetical protein